MAGAVPGAAVRGLSAGQPMRVKSRQRVPVVASVRVVAREKRATREVVLKVTINLDIIGLDGRAGCSWCGC